MGYSFVSHGGAARVSTLIVDADLDLAGFSLIDAAIVSAGLVQAGDVDAAGDIVGDGIAAGGVVSYGSLHPALAYMRSLIGDFPGVAVDSPAGVFPAVIGRRIPHMSSATTPRGTVTFSTQYNPTTYPAWHAFAWVTTTAWLSQAGHITNQWLQYQFHADDRPTTIYGVVYMPWCNLLDSGTTGITFSTSPDGVTWTEHKTWDVPLFATATPRAFLLDTPITAPDFNYVRFFFPAEYGGGTYISAGIMQVIGSI